jgi:hypothetical protein
MEFLANGRLRLRIRRSAHKAGRFEPPLPSPSGGRLDSSKQIRCQRRATRVSKWLPLMAKSIRQRQQSAGQRPPKGWQPSGGLIPYSSRWQPAGGLIPRSSRWQPAGGLIPRSSRWPPSGGLIPRRGVACYARAAATPTPRPQPPRPTAPGPTGTATRFWPSASGSPAKLPPNPGSCPPTTQCPRGLLPGFGPATRRGADVTPIRRTALENIV